MARNPKKASQSKRAKKTKIQDLPAGKKVKGVKGGAVDAFVENPTTIGSTQLSSFSLNFKKI